MCNWKKGFFLLYQEHQRCRKVQQTKNRRRPTGVVEATASSISLVQLARVEEEPAMVVGSSFTAHTASIVLVVVVMMAAAAVVVAAVLLPYNAF